MIYSDAVVMHPEEAEEPCHCPSPSRTNLGADECITAFKGKTEAMQEWLDSGADINAIMGLGYTFLHAACAGGSADAVRVLMRQNGLHLNIKNHWGRTPLMAASRRGREECVRILLFTKHKCKIDLTLKDNDGNTALALAAREKHWGILKLLMRQRVEYDIDSLNIALFKVVHTGQWEDVQYLLANYQGFEEETINAAVTRASADNNVKVLRLLLEKYIGVCDYETLSTARSSAHLAGYEDVERLLIMSLNEYIFAKGDDETGGRIVPKNRSDGVPLNAPSNFTSQLLPLQLSVRPVRTPFPPGPDVYDTTTSPRGIVLVLNYNEFQGHREMQREGSIVDILNLKSLFHQMDYETQVFINLSREQTLSAVNVFVNQERLESVGCVVVTIMSHGMDRHTFQTTDMEYITVPEIQNLFLDRRCPALKNKPKIFLLNFCRGLEVPRRFDTDAALEQPRNLICIYSTTENFKSYRDPQRGCPFIREICEVLAEHAHEMDLDGLIREFQVKYLPKMTPEVQNFGFHKRFYFNPAGSGRSQW